MSEKPVTGFRFSAATLGRLNALSRSWGVSKAAVLERLVEEASFSRRTIIQLLNDTPLGVFDSSRDKKVGA